MVSVATATADGLVPADYKEFFENYDKYGKEADHVSDMSFCETTPEGQKVIKMIMNCPWPLWNRMLISTFYNHFEQDDGSLICLFSCVGNEELKAKHFDDHCKANYVLAT